jgi:hypothetical protein
VRQMLYSGKTPRLPMRFEQCMGWCFTFHDRDKSRALFRESTSAHSEKIEHLVARTTILMMLQDKHSFRAGYKELVFYRSMCPKCNEADPAPDLNPGTISEGV